MKDEEKKIQWTKGTDKSEVEVVLEWWRNELGDSPNENSLIRLEQEIMKRNKRINDAEKSYRGNDDISEKFIIMEKKITKALQSLLDTFRNEKIQVGRPPDFIEGDSLRWYNKLKAEEEYQHKNGKPHKTKIREEIRERHYNKTGHKPSLKTIKRHV